MVSQIDQGTQEKITVEANSDWTLVELSLADYYEALLTGKSVVSLCAGFLKTGTNFDTAIYYMGGFEIFNKE